MEIKEFLEENGLYKEYNPKDYIQKMDFQREYGVFDGSLKRCINVKPSVKQLKNSEKITFARPVKFGIVVPIMNTDEDVLRQMIESILKQTYKNFILYIVDRSDKAHAYLANVCIDYDDSRIVYRKLPGGQSLNWDSFVCDYIVLMNEMDALNALALSELCGEINENEADFIYSNSGIFRKKLYNVVNCILRPGFARINLETYNYIGDFLCFDRNLIDLDSEYNVKVCADGAYQVIKEVAKNAKKATCIRKELYLENIAKKHKLRIYKRNLKRDVRPLVSIILASNGNVKDVSRIINSIEILSTYSNYEIVIIESAKEGDTTLLYRYFKILSKEKNVRFLYKKGDNKLSSIYNYAAKHTKGEYLVFLDCSVEVASYEWIEEMLSYAIDGKCALISPKILDRDKNLRYAGAYYTKNSKSPVRVEDAKNKDFTRNVSIACTQAVMISKEIFEKLGGFSNKYTESMFIEDLSLKALEKKYANVYVPSATFIQYGKNMSRKAADVSVFSSLWKEMLEYDEYKEG